MLLNALRSGALFAALSTATTLDVAIARRGGYADICPAGVSEVTVTHHLVHYPVLINTQINANTVIIINGGVTINVNNAPTHLSTTVTVTKHETSTATVTAAATPFVIALVEGPAVKAKRQDTAIYLQVDGSTTTDCTAADTFEVGAGRLFGNGKLYGALPTATQAIFANTNAGNITTTFSIDPELSWSNPAFANTDVAFVMVSGFVNAIFAGEPPVSSTSLTLKSIPLKDTVCGATKKMKKRGARPMRVKARGNFPRF